MNASVTVLEVIQRSADYLGKKGVESSRLQIELLLAHALKIPRLNLYLNFERKLTDSETDAVRKMVKRRGNREPLQHIIGAASFCGLEMRVTPSVLVPRPETELLAERAWKLLNELAPSEPQSIDALDFGTGSGCLAVAIAVHVPRTRVCALEISPAAVEVASQNAAAHRVSNRIQFVCGDGFDALSKDSKFDLIVSNPPYISSREIETLQPEIRDFDPRLALDGGEDGLDFYRRFATRAKTFLKNTGLLMVEFGDAQADPIKKMFVDQGWTIEAVECDYSRRPRILIARP